MILPNCKVNLQNSNTNQLPTVDWPCKINALQSCQKVICKINVLRAGRCKETLLSAVLTLRLGDDRGLADDVHDGGGALRLLARLLLAGAARLFDGLHTLFVYVGLTHCKGQRVGGYKEGTTLYKFAIMSTIIHISFF